MSRKHKTSQIGRTPILFLAACAVLVTPFLSGQTPVKRPQPSTAVNAREFFDEYGVVCHDSKVRTAGLALDALDVTKPAEKAEIWEKVIAKLRAGSMPPPGMPRADAATYRALATSLEAQLDRAWATH